MVTVDTDAAGFKVTLDDGEIFTSRRVIVATGIAQFVRRPAEFSAIPPELASDSSEHSDLTRFKGCRTVVIGGGQSALESAALLYEYGADVEVIVRQSEINWVGLHSWLHHLGPISSFYILPGVWAPPASAVWWRCLIVSKVFLEEFKIRRLIERLDLQGRRGYVQG